MKFKKLFLTFAAVTAVSTAMAVSASAAMEAKYDKDTAPNVVKLTGAELEDGENTIVLFSGKNADVTTITSGIIKYINQGDKAQTYFVSIPVDTLDDGDYTVKVGGENGAIQVAEFKVGAPYKNPDRLLGDVTNDSQVSNADALVILEYDASGEGLDDLDTLSSADANDDGQASNADALLVLEYDATGEGELGAEPKLKDKVNAVQ